MKETSYNFFIKDREKEIAEGTDPYIVQYLMNYQKLFLFIKDYVNKNKDSELKEVLKHFEYCQDTIEDFEIKK